MATYNEDEMGETPPKLANGKKEHVVIFHDESTFHANDHPMDYWLWPGEVVLKKKEHGQLIMTSGFICQKYGNIALPEEMVAENALLPDGKQLEHTDSHITIYLSLKQGSNDYRNGAGDCPGVQMI